MAIDKKIKYDIQGGVKNYLGKQKEVKAPLKWQSSPEHPTTELAYITKAEKDLLVKSDLHGSLKGGVNRGPSGIMSLNGWGDANEGMADKSFGGNERRGTTTTQDGPNPHTASGTSPRTVTTRTVNTMPDVVDQKYSGDGWFSGYRNLDARGQPKMGLAYLGDRLKSFVPGVMGAFMGNPWVGTGFNALKSFARPGQTLTGWWGDRQNWSGDDEEDFTSDYALVDGQYKYVGDPMDDTFSEFRQKYPLDLSNQGIVDVESIRAMIENAKNQGSS
jgi:hypothetical protein